MRIALLILLTGILHTNLPAQDQPVKWHAVIEKLSDTQFALHLQANIEKGWWLYADNLKDDINGLKVTIADSILSPTEALQTKEQDVLVRDAVFEKSMQAFTGAVNWTQQTTLTGNGSVVKLHVTGFAGNGKEFIPVDEIITVQVPGAKNINAFAYKRSSINIEKPTADCGETVVSENNSLLNVFMKGFGGGLIALLMPCIFPMLPVTVSFFMNKAKTKRQGIRNGIMYGGFILLIYLLISIPFHIVGNVNPQLFNIISTNKWVNLSFFFVFIAFAVSLFGAFELKLPGGLANTAGMKSGTESIGGIFFMALTLAVVSFSCTGPILGFLLVNSLSGGNGAWMLTTGLAGFGLALALPFGLFAMFPQWLKQLPKSGGWMETLKKSLGFVELALALKFLSNADTVEHWGILKREVFIGLWVVICIALSLYLFGYFNRGLELSEGAHGGIALKKIKPAISNSRIFAAILVLLFAFYLLPGITNSSLANLKFVSGFPPPMSYSIYEKHDEENYEVVPDVVNDYKSALALSKEQGKPLLIDFTGWACVNCRKMEESVWTNPWVANIIKNKFILVSLYVDDRKKLPAADKSIYKNEHGEERDIQTVGDKWATFQAENFGSASQPQYVILSSEEELLNHPVGFSSVKDYREWLECGLRANEQRKQVASQ